MEAATTIQVTFNVFRFNKETDYLPHYKKYVLDVSKDNVMLDILNIIKWEHDSSFTYRRSCRHGICGSCAIKVNDKAVLACKERVIDLIEMFGTELTITPQSENRAIKDMVIDKADFWDKYASVKPYLVAEIEEHPASENMMTPQEYDHLEEADYCIQCGACYYQCTSAEVNEDYLGPAALALSYRFNFDIRDQAKHERLDTVNEIGPGIWDCVKCFECADACPKGVNPIDKITKLHLQTFEEGKADNNVATRHAVYFKKTLEKHGYLDEGMLVAYSEGMGVVKHIPEALTMFKKGKIPMPWSMPKSKNHDEIKKLVKSSSTVKF